MAFIEVEDVQVLQIGVWVKLEGFWFSHPFPTNTFTIKSAEDLATIQGLTNVTILYDPVGPSLQILSTCPITMTVC